MKQIYNNENSDISEYILVISFGDEENKIDSKYENAKYNINFDNQNNELINISDLYFSNQFQMINPRNISISLYWIKAIITEQISLLIY